MIIPSFAREASRFRYFSPRPLFTLCCMNALNFIPLMIIPFYDGKAISWKYFRLYAAAHLFSFSVHNETSQYDDDDDDSRL